MIKQLRQKIVKKTTSKKGLTEILANFKLKTESKNQLLTFFKPEVFLDKTPEQTAKIIDLAFNKLEEHEVTIDGAAVFSGPSLGKHAIMDRHYGVINTLSKHASKVLTPEERKLVFKALGIKNKNTRILGGHEAFEISGMGTAYEFDNNWLSSPSTKIKSGFYVRSMKVADENMVVVNGFHPHQLDHYTAPGRFSVVLLVSTNTAWARLRNDMLGDSFPEKAHPASIRGILHSKPQEFGFEKVGIGNNVVHLSAGPSEALFEIDNFLRAPFGIDFLASEAKLAEELLREGISKTKIREILTNRALHEELEHKDTDEAVKIIKTRLGK